MAINYEKWKNRWSTNEVIVLVLLSLGMQICLIILAPFRKRSKNTVLKLTLWLLYLTADSVAILALGNISNQADPEESGDSGTMTGKLTVLWAPFLLIHLGGPDSITSYSVEDNELWWRHLLGLFVQVVVTVYVFWQSPPKGWMWAPTMLVFIPGLIKFAERTHALRLGSKDNLKDKIISELPLGKDEQVVPDSIRKGQRDGKGEIKENQVGTSTSEHHAIAAIGTNENTPESTRNSTRNSKRESERGTEDNRMHTSILGPGTVQANATKSKVELTESEKESEKESQYICEGYKWFDKFKRLLVDVTFSSNLLMQSQDRFSEMDAKDALNLVAIELSFMYDILHTKAVHMHNNVGRVLRGFSLVSIIAALVVFLHLDMQKYASKDIIITYILFGAGLIIEVIAIVLLISSDWTVVSLRKKGWQKCIACAITSMVKGITFRKGKSRWSRNIGQFSLVGLCLRDRYTPRTWIMKKLHKLKHIWDNMRESRTIHLPKLFQEIMFTEAKRRAQNVHIYNVLKEARSYRGGKALERHGKLKDLEWSMKMEFDESIILWHVATDICYYEEFTPNLSNRNGPDTVYDVSWKTSNYMIYLLTQQQSMMQLGYGKTRFEATCAVVKEKFKGEGKLDHKKARNVLKKNEGATKNEDATKNEGAAKNEGATQVPGQNNASVSADRSQPTNKLCISVLKNLWANLRSWGRRKREENKRKREDVEEMGNLVLKNGLKLANELQELKPEIKWKLISETWMEMLGYAAIHCDSYQHAKSLRRGGELLTHLWLLMSQLGVVEEHKMQQYQSGSV